MKSLEKIDFKILISNLLKLLFGDLLTTICLTPYIKI